MNQLVLLLVHRIPYDAGVTHLLIAPSAYPSFPSDHASATVAIAAAFLLHGMRSLGLLFSATAALIIISRVYIGTRYLGDVIGGAATASLVRVSYREGTQIDRLVIGIL